MRQSSNARFARTPLCTAIFAACILATSTALAGAAAQPRGTLAFYTDPAAFNAALGVPSNLVTEHFDGGAPVGPFPTLCNEPMGSTSNDVCFTPGQLVPGFGITSTSGAGIIIFPNLFLGPGQTTRAVGATTFADETIVSFSPTISAASAEVYGGLSVNPVDIEIFDESGASLGTTVVPAAATRDTPTFFAVISPTPIGKITFDSENGGGELIDDLQFRAAGALPPGLVKSFAPSGIPVGGTSTLTITLGNPQSGAATLTADLTDTLPSGLVIAGTPNASTDCASGIVAAVAGSGSVTLDAGAAIPGSGTCTVTVDVTTATVGAYANTIAAGALQTDLGSNADPANATLLVSTGQSNTFPPAENFDEVFAPDLPTGWTSSTSTGANDWFTEASNADTAPNSAHAPETPTINDFTLDTPEFTPVAGQNVTFHHKYNFERRFDGAVLEISINGGAFADILDAGGSFVTGGYSYTIFEGSGNPLTDRLVWTGDSNGYMTTTATLPPSAVGQPTRLRFRTADDASNTADGDNGWWIDSIVLGVNPQPPIATVAPTSLSFAVDPDATASDTLTLTNETGSEPLTFTVESRGSSSHRPRLVPHADLVKKTNAPNMKPLVPRERATIGVRDLGGSHRASTVPWAPDGGLMLAWDDGSAETALGAGTQGPPSSEQAGVYLNRFSASDALVIHSISVFWPVGDGDLTGLQANLVVYYDADGDGDPTNAVRVGTDMLVPISITGNFETYETNFSIPAAGDVYIGFVDQWALAGGFTPRLFPAALDESPSHDMSYISSTSAPPVDIVNLGNNEFTGTIFDVEQGSLDGNFMIRASATGGGGGGACTGPIVSWLSATPATGSVSGGSNTSVTVSVSAAGLAQGVYTADLCITTNDPSRSLIAVPVSMTVGTPPPAPCSGADELFCDGFDTTQGGGTVVSGTIGQSIADSSDGSSFDFATGDYHGYDGSITSDDINLYDLVGGGPQGDGMYVYWYGDLVPPDFTNFVGGVVDSSGVDFAVLHSGDTIGPDSVVSGGSTIMTNWISGADGYIGVAFYNEGTGTVNYGYLHVTTTGPLGFPAEALDWAYDNTGAAITIP